MATDRSERRARPARHGVAVAILLLLPFLALAGAFAPGVVTIVAEDRAVAQGSRPAAPPIQLPRKPILIPRDFSTGFMPELLDLDHLFARASRGDFVQQIGGAPAFALRTGQTLVIDDLEEFASETLFKDVLKPSFVSSTRGTPFDPSIFDLLPALFGPDSEQQFDDFAGTGNGTTTIIPEPGTFAMVALGLIGLGRLGRQRQPATS